MLVLALLTGLWVPGLTEPLSLGGTGPEAVDAALACPAGRPETRWLPRGDGYEETASFGDGDDEWIVSVGGLASDGDRVFLYDRGRPLLSILSAELELIGEVGREGQGPGEFRQVRLPFSMPPNWDVGFVDGGAQGIVVFDSEHFELFDSSGSATGTVSGWSNWPSPAGGVRYVALDSNGRLLFAVDSINMRSATAVRRMFQTWRLTEDGAEKVWELRLPDVPRTGTSGYVMPGRQARVRWALYGHCVVANDGESRTLYVFDEQSSTTDSVLLPEWDVPEIGKEDRSAGTIPGRAGRRIATGGQLPTAVARWMNMSVDPDGHVWIEPWSPDQEGPSRPFVVNLLNGHATRVSVPTFPIAFGTPGVFYGVVKDTNTDEATVNRFDLR